MASANLSAYNAALKQTWTQTRLEEQLYQDSGLLADIEKTTRFQVGQQARTPLHVTRNGGYSALAAGGGTLNTAGNQGIKQATWNYTHHHQQIAVEGELIDGTLSDALTVANGVDTEVTGGLTDLRRQLTRQVATAGNGVIAVCGTTSGSTTVVLNSTDGQNAIERGWLFENALVDIGTAANPTLRVAGAKITAVDDSAYTITIDSSVTTASTDQVSYKGSRGVSTSNEMNGINSIVSTSSTLGGLTTAGERQWKAAFATSTAQAITLPLVYQAPRAIRQRSGELPDTIWTSFKQEENVYKLLQTQVRYQGEGNLGTGNRDALKIAGMTLKADFDVKNEEMHFFPMKHLFICATDKPYWQNKVTGGEILAWIQNTDSYGAKVTYRIQLCTNRRNVFGSYTGLS